MSRCVDEIIHTLKITLLDVEPAIWRRVRVPGAMTLADVHRVFQTTLGWGDCHMHFFRAGDESYGVADREFPEVKDEKRTTLAELAQRTWRFAYAYDPGDGWEHEVVIEPPDASRPLQLTCIGGARCVRPKIAAGRRATRT